ncbi:MAG TPA: aminoacyl-tRNA hydrolase [Candidatus Limnocylindrales bacterium]|nr:aminoacyl-tRNA hydrolase [Candidatus Limnocylindrales bacterium]
MKLIVGLGNPGEQYESTRHNLGFTVIEHFLKDITSAKKAVWSANSKLKSDIVVLDWEGKKGAAEKIILAKPQTFMNNSGMAVNLILKFYKIKPEDLWVVYDELDLPVGSLKIRFGGAAAGHHGVESIMEKLATDKFWRFRMGIGASHDKEHVISKQNIKKAKEFVLSPFGTGDKGKIRELVKHGSDALESALEKGIEAAMNRYNTR